MYRNYRLFDMAYVNLTSFFFEVRHVIFWDRSLKVLKAALRKFNSVENCEQVVLLTPSCQYSLYLSWIFCLKCDLPWIILPDINRNYVKLNRICERCCVCCDGWKFEWENMFQIFFDSKFLWMSIKFWNTW